MNLDALKEFAKGYLKGYFGAVGLMLSNTPTHSVTDISEYDPGSSDLPVGFSALMVGVVEGGGAIGVLLKGSDVNAILGAFTGEERSTDDSIEGGNPDELKKVYEPCVGGGSSYFKETYSNPVELERIEVKVCNADALAELAQQLGPAALAKFEYSLPDLLESTGALLISDSLECIIPVPDPAAEDESLSREEVEGILGDFGDGQDEEGSPGAKRDSAVQAPGTENIDRVLDISLTATARLGRVEMPVGDILMLGPGSIIEVGHVVDEPVELLVNDKLIARGDVVVVDEKFGLRITEIVSPEERIESLS